MESSKRALTALNQLRKHRERRAGNRLQQAERKRRDLREQLNSLAGTIEEQQQNQRDRQDSLFAEIQGRPLTLEQYQAYLGELERFEREQRDLRQERNERRIELFNIERERASAQSEYRHKTQQREKSDEIARFMEQRNREAALRQEESAREEMGNQRSRT